MTEQLNLFPEPERQIEMFEPAPDQKPEAPERKRLKLIRLDDPRRPRNRARTEAR